MVWPMRITLLMANASVPTYMEEPYGSFRGTS
ncbi:hypothetical protein OKW39_007758 [Paraburkholderia sp. MM6662-R1]